MLDVITIGDALKDIFVFPSIDEMEKPISGSLIHQPRDEKFLVLGYGDKITISDSEYSIGGTACNVAVALSRLHVKSGIICSVGEDSEGQQILSNLEDNKVDTSLVDISSKKKTSFSVIISYKGERSILVYHSFGPEDFIFPEQFEANWLYLSPMGEGYSSIYTKAVALAAEKNIKIVINPGSIQIHDGLQALRGVLSVAKILFVNKDEGQKLAQLNGVVTMREVAKSLLKTGVEMVVVTDGQNGSAAVTKEDYVQIGIFPGDRLDSTGAGDSFASAFLAGIIKKEKIVTALKMGAINSASVVGKIGAQGGLLNLTTIRKRMSEYHWPSETFKFN